MAIAPEPIPFRTPEIVIMPSKISKPLPIVKLPEQMPKIRLSPEKAIVFARKLYEAIPDKKPQIKNAARIAMMPGGIKEARLSANISENKETFSMIIDLNGRPLVLTAVLATKFDKNKVVDTSTDIVLSDLKNNMLDIIQQRGSSFKLG